MSYQGNNESRSRPYRSEHDEEVESQIKMTIDNEEEYEEEQNSQGRLIFFRYFVIFLIARM